MNPFDKMAALREKALESLKPEPKEEEEKEVQAEKPTPAKESGSKK